MRGPAATCDALMREYDEAQNLALRLELLRWRMVVWVLAGVLVVYGVGVLALLWWLQV